MVYFDTVKKEESGGIDRSCKMEKYKARERYELKKDSYSTKSLDALGSRVESIS